MRMKEKEVRERCIGLMSLRDLSLPARMSFAIAHNLEVLEKEAGKVEEERQRLCREYAKKDDDGNPVIVSSVIDGKETQEYSVTNENKKLLMEELNEVMETEVDIDIRTVKTDVVEQCDASERYHILTAAQLMAVSFMLEE